MFEVLSFKREKKVLHWCCFEYLINNLTSQLTGAVNETVPLCESNLIV